MTAFLSHNIIPKVTHRTAFLYPFYTEQHSCIQYICICIYIYIYINQWDFSSFLVSNILTTSQEWINWPETKWRIRLPLTIMVRTICGHKLHTHINCLSKIRGILRMAPDTSKKLKFQLQLDMSTSERDFIIRWSKAQTFLCLPSLHDFFCSHCIHDIFLLHSHHARFSIQ